jgi:transcriptional regulator with XRE-family HTH domain
MKRVVATPVPPDPLVHDPRAFGAAIRAARTGAGMTLADAALAIGIAKQTLSDLESAKASVGLATALRAARELGLAVLAVSSDEREPLRRMITGTRQASAATALADAKATPHAGGPNLGRQNKE